MGGSPVRIESKAQIFVHTGELGGILQMVNGVIARLRLTAPVGRSSFLGISDGEGIAGNRLAYKLGVLGRKAILDIVNLGVFGTGDGNLVALAPVPGEAHMGTGLG